MKSKANTEIRNLMKINEISQFELSEVFGVCEMTIQRKLRKEMSDEDKTQFMNAIQNIVAKRKEK